MVHQTQRRMKLICEQCGMSYDDQCVECPYCLIPVDEKPELERCEHCGNIVDECECHVWFEEY